MLHKRFKKCLAFCLSAILAVTCLPSSIPIAHAADKGGQTLVNLAKGMNYTTDFYVYYPDGDHRDLDHSKLTDGNKGSADWNDPQYVGFKAIESTPEGDKQNTDRYYSIDFNFGEAKEINGLNFYGYCYTPNYIYTSKTYQIQYKDVNGEWQTLYTSPNQGYPDGKYTGGYTIPDGGTVTATAVRLNVWPWSAYLFLSEVEVIGLGTATNEPDPLVNLAKGMNYSTDFYRYYPDGEHQDLDHSKLTDGNKGSTDWNDPQYVGFKAIESTPEGDKQNTDRYYSIDFNFDEAKEINGLNFYGYCYTPNYIYTSKTYQIQYKDVNGEWQTLYTSPNQAYPDGAYTGGYAIPDGGTVTATAVRLNVWPWSLYLFLSEVEVMGLGTATNEPAPDPSGYPNIATGIKYTSNWTDMYSGYEDASQTILTDGLQATAALNANSVGFTNNTGADEKLELAFNFGSKKKVLGMNFSGWVDDVNSIVAPADYEFRYCAGNDEMWLQWKSGTVNLSSDNYKTTFIGTDAMDITKIKLILTVPAGKSVFLDEVQIFGEKATNPSTIDPNNIIGGLTYTTRLIDGDANANTGDFHSEHPDVDRIRLTDGKKVPTNGTWGNENTIGFHSPKDSSDKRVDMTFEWDETKSFQQISFGAFADAGSGINFPTHALIEYKDESGTWQTLYDKDISAAGYSHRYTYLVPDDKSISCKGIRFWFTLNSGWLFMDEIEALETSVSNYPDLNPEASKCTNLIQDIPYITTLKDGDANKEEGNFHGDHPDLQRKLLTDGLRSGDWNSPNVVMFNARDSQFTIPADIMFDLGEVKSFEEINISCLGNGTVFIPAKASILVSNDGLNWQTVYYARWDVDKAMNKEFVLTSLANEPISARYVKINLYHSFYWMALDEIQIFDKATGAASDGTLTLKQPPLEMLRGVDPTISEDGKHIVIPDSPSEYYNVMLGGSDNKTVIDENGNIHTPLVDTKVNLLYKAVEKANPDNVLYADYNVTLTIPGSTSKTTSDNLMPDTMPSMREWKGYTGEFTLKDTSAIVVDTGVNAKTKDVADKIASFFKDMLKKEVPVRVGTPVAGDVYLQLDSSIPELGKEGYYMDVQDIVTIKAPDYTGLLYGGISATQILYADDDHMNIPKGIARDYPEYESRGGLIDVARAPITMDYLKEITRYMAWFKLNEIHLHLNDRGEGNYVAFRLQRDKYPEITSKDVSYTKEEYRNYQYEAMDYGIKVISEFETPGHASAFSKIPGVKMLDPNHIDITDKTTVDIIKTILDEYLDGPNPVIVTDTVHIGTDEYAYNKSALRAYTYDITNYIMDKGYTTRYYGGYDENTGIPDDSGITKARKGAQTDYWASANFPTLQDMYNLGYDVVNMYNMLLYSVPGTNYSFPDYLNMGALYDAWNVNWFEWNGAVSMPLGHPQTLGANFAVWNDLHTSNGGFSQYDVFERVKNSVMIVSEKTWHGEKSEGQNQRSFLNRVDKFWNHVAGANPTRQVESKTGHLVNYDFESTNGNTVYDNSGNGYNATLNNATIVPGKDGNGVSLDGSSYMSLPVDGIGFPYVAEFDVKLNSNNANSTLFSGRDGVFYTNVNGSGKMGFRRDPNNKYDPYTFTFDYQLPVNEWVHVKITCDAQAQKTILTVNGTDYPAINNLTLNCTLPKETQFSTTSVLPTAKIGEGMQGVIDNLSVVNPNIQYVGPVRNPNLALNCPVTISAPEVDYAYGPEMAVDGNYSVGSRVSFSRADKNQWLIIDLGKVQDINRIVLTPFEQAKEFQMFVSEDGQNWKKVFYKLVDGNAGETGQVYTIDFDTTAARYVKYEQLDFWYTQLYGGSSWSGGITEIEVYNWKGDYDINISDLVNGTVTTDKNTANEGDTITLTVTPANGYHVESVKVNGTAITAVSGVYSFTMPASNVTLDVTFAVTSSDKVDYDINISDPVNGTVTLDKKTANEGDTVTLTVTPANGYHVESVKVNGTAITAVSDVYSFTMPASNVTLDVTFAVTSSGSGYDGDTSKPTTQKPEIVVLPNGTVVISPDSSVDKATNTALSKITLANLKAALDKSQVGNDGAKRVTIEVKEIKGALNYVQEIPLKELMAKGTNISLNIATPVGSVEFTNDELKGLGINESDTLKISVSSIEAGEKTKPAVNVSVKAGDKVWSDIKLPIKVSLDYTLSKAELKESEYIVARNIDEKGNTKVIANSKYDLETGKMVFTVLNGGNYEVVFVKKTFDDLDKTPWAKKSIEVLASRDIISGVSANEFNPAVNISRADFILLLVKTLGLTAEFEYGFDDVMPKDYYYDALGIAKQLGITTGTGNNKFNPAEKISRQDMMVMVAKALQVADKKLESGEVADLQKYSDSENISSYAIDSVAALVKDGIIKGSSNLINPKGNATRAEIAVVMYKLLNK